MFELGRPKKVPRSLIFNNSSNLYQTTHANQLTHSSTLPTAPTLASTQPTLTALACVVRHFSNSPYYDLNLKS